MKRLLAALFILPAITMFAESSPSAAAKPTTAPAVAAVKDRPLTELPYTPSLDLESLDRTVEPCADFYQFSCGGWMAKNPIPPDQASWDVYGKLTDENARYLWSILEDAAKPSPDRTPVQQKIGDYFAACMNESAINKLGVRPVEPLLARIEAIKSKDELAALIASVHDTTFGGGWLFGSGSFQEFSDATSVIAGMSAGGISLPDRDYYTNDDEKSKEIRAKFVKHVARMLELSGEPKAKAASDAAAVLQLETELAKASLTRVESRNPHNLDHKMTRAQFAELAPSFSWDRYFTDRGLGGVSSLNVTEPAFFKAVETQLKAVPLAQWKSYLRWHALHERAQYLAQAFVNEDFDFYRKTLRGVAEPPPRWKSCVRYVDRDLGEALGQEFVSRTFTGKTREKTVDMTRRVEIAMENEIKTLDWMTEATRQRALEKLHSIANKVGYPERWRDYSALAINRGDFFGNISRSIEFETKRDLSKIGKPLDRGEWTMTPPTVNAYYNPQMNDINFPAGVLQPPLFDPKLDDAPNYGNTGATIGHELTHAFDDEGRLFDAKGNLADWWTPEDAKEFEARVQCVRDQYAQYTIVDDIKINSKLTSGEDVADIGGTLLAYIAWKDATANENLQTVDGFSPDQRFFIGMAQWACQNQRPENLRANAITNPHSPNKYRINGVVVNLPEFGRAFKCGDDKPMATKKACKVW